MGALQILLLFGICCPCFTAILELAGDAGIVHGHFGQDYEFWILPDTGGKSSKNCSSLPKALVGLDIMGQILADGSKVGELVENI